MGRLNNFQFSIFNFQKNSKNSFTLIETIIVVGITGMILPVVFSIVFVIFQQQAKIIRLQEVRRQGDFVLASIKTTIRNSAVQIFADQMKDNEVCILPSSEHSNNGEDNLYFIDKLGYMFYYDLESDLESDKISSYSGASNKEFLTSDKVKITDFIISCQRQTAYTPPIIKIKLSLEYDTLSTQAQDKASLTYNTYIKLKSF